ncbi:MAG TPA: hypothetical protein VLG36_01990 [Candidatus Chromulinivoraceae bacterium]|nr:hypothetical protein [Candidatus Chromulinivoraceae bacterium]
MKPKKISKPTAKDKSWQKKVEERLKNEKVELDHTQGKKRFEEAVKRALKNKATS